MLERDAHLAHHAVQRSAFEARLAVARIEEPGQHPRERRLARAVVPDDQHGFAAVDAQVHVGERTMRPRRMTRVHVAGVTEDEQRITPARRHDQRRVGIGDHRRRLGHDAPRLERDHAIRARGLRRAVRHVHDRDAVTRHERAQQCEQLGAARTVDHRGRFVGDQELRPARERGGHRQALELTAGERGRLAIGERSQPDAIEQRVDVDGRHIARRARPLQAPHDVVTDAHAEHLQLGPLEHDGGTAGHAEAGRAGSDHLPRGRAAARKHAGQRRLARAVRTDDRDELATLDLERDVAQDVGAGARIAVADRTQRNGNGRGVRRAGRASLFVTQVDARVGCERGAHATERRRGDALRERGGDDDDDEQDHRDSDPPVVEETVDHLVAAVRDVRRERDVQIVEEARDAAPRVVHLREQQLPIRRKDEQQHVDDDRDERPQDARRDPDGAADAVAPPGRDADDRAERAARHDRRDHRRTENQKTDGRRRKRARDDRPHAVPRGQRGHRDHCDDEERRPDGDHLARDRQHEREIGEDDCFGQLPGLQPAPTRPTGARRTRRRVGDHQGPVGTTGITLRISARLWHHLGMAKNVLGGELAPCSFEPLTGFYRDGCCESGGDDEGVHSVCVVMTSEFLEFSREHGNDLSTPMPAHGFAGLVAGDRWCLCAPRWQEAYEAGRAPEVVLEATHARTLEWCTLSALQAHAASS